MARIYLAVGHGISQDGNFDNGCCYDVYTEAGLMLPIVKEAAKILRANGVTVYTDADHANNKNMVATVATANELGVDAYVSVHCDYSLAPSGTLPIVYPGSKSGMKLAQCIDKAFRAETKEGTRGILQRDDYEVSYTNMPACIFETGAIKADLSTLKKYSACGKGIAKGICQYFGIKMKTEKKYKPKKVRVTGKWSTKTTKLAQYVFKSGTIDGIVSGQRKSDKKHLPKASTASWRFNDGDGSALIKKMQKKIGSKATGYASINFVKILQEFLKKNKFYDGEHSGTLNAATVKALQRFLNNKIK